MNLASSMCRCVTERSIDIRGRYYVAITMGHGITARIPSHRRPVLYQRSLGYKCNCCLYIYRQNYYTALTIQSETNLHRCLPFPGLHHLQPSFEVYRSHSPKRMSGLKVRKNRALALLVAQRRNLAAGWVKLLYASMLAMGKL